MKFFVYDNIIPVKKGSENGVDIAEMLLVDDDCARPDRARRRTEAAGGGGDCVIM